MKKQVLLASINDVKKLVNLVNRFDFDVDLVSGRYIIDAKSIMGIFSLDLSIPIGLEADCPDDHPFWQEIAPFVVEE